MIPPLPSGLQVWHPLLTLKQVLHLLSVKRKNPLLQALQVAESVQEIQPDRVDVHKVQLEPPPPVRKYPFSQSKHTELDLHI